MLEVDLNEQAHITLFNDERYQRVNIRSPQRPFRYDHIIGKSIVGTLSGVLDGELLECGYSAPFGGVDWVRGCESGSTIMDLICGASLRARAEGVREIKIRARPEYFGGNEVTTAFVLLNLGASIESCELSLGLEVWRYSTAERYKQALRSTERRILRRGLALGMVFSLANTAEEWGACYELLAETRRRRSAQLRISLEYVLGLREIFSGRIAMYQLQQGGDLAAAALVYRVRPEWNYVVAWGDNPKYRPNKVMNILAYQLVKEAIDEGVAVIDLGISSVDGMPDDGLILFKRNIGAATGLRSNFRLLLA
jgi:hypothetical protein